LISEHPTAAPFSYKEYTEVIQWVPREKADQKKDASQATAPPPEGRDGYPTDTGVDEEALALDYEQYDRIKKETAPLSDERHRELDQTQLEDDYR